LTILSRNLSQHLRKAAAIAAVVIALFSVSSSSIRAEDYVREYVPTLDVQRGHFYDTLTLFFNQYSENDEPGALTVNDCLKIARENNLDLSIAASKSTQAAYKIDEVKSAQNPTLNGLATYLQRGPIPNLSFGGMSFNMINNSNYDARLTAQYLISNFGILDNSKKIAYLSYIRTRVDEDRVLSNLNLEVLKTFFTIVETKGYVAVARKAIKARETQYGIAKAHYDEGVFPKYEVIRANVSLKQAEEAIISAVRSYELTKAQLLKTLGLEQTATVDVKRPRFEIYKLPELEQCIDQSYKYRPELIQMELAVQIGKANVDLAGCGMNPTLLLTGTYDYQTESIATQPSAWSAMVTISMPIFDGGATYSKVKQAQEALKQAQLGRDQMKRDIALQVKSAHLSVIESIKKLDTAEANLDQAKEAYDIALVRYQEGVGTTVDLDNALVGYLQSNSSLLSAYCEYERSWATLINSMGYTVKGVDYEQVYSSPKKGR
jgi:outer membrane protein TolC